MAHESRFEQSKAYVQLKQQIVEQFTPIVNNLEQFPDTDSFTVHLPNYVLNGIKNMDDNRMEFPFYYVIVLHKGFYIDSQFPIGNINDINQQTEVRFERHPDSISLQDFEDLYARHKSGPVPYISVDDTRKQLPTQVDAMRKQNYMHKMLRATVETRDGRTFWKLPEYDTKKTVLDAKTLYYRTLVDFIDVYMPNPQPFMEDHQLWVNLPDIERGLGFDHLWQSIKNLGLNLDDSIEEDWDKYRLYRMQKYHEVTSKLIESDLIKPEDVEYVPPDDNDKHLWVLNYQYRQIERLINLAGYFKSENTGRHGYVLYE